VFRPRFTGDTERVFLASGIFCHLRAGGDRFGDPRDDLRAGDRFGDSRDDLRAGDLFGDPREALRAGDLFGDPLEGLRGDLRVDLPGDLLVGDPLDDLLEGRGDLLRGDPLDDLLGDLLGDLIGDFPNVLPGGDFPGDFRLLDLFKLLLLDLLLACAPTCLPFDRLLLLFNPTFSSTLALTGLLLASRLLLLIVKRKFDLPLGFTVILRSGDPLPERVESLLFRTSRASLGVVDLRRLSGFELEFFIGDSAICVAGLPSSRANKFVTSLNRFLGAGRLCFGSHRSP